MPEFLTHWLAQYGALALFAIMALGILGLPIPEETTLVFAGVLVYRGHMQPLPAILAAFLGSVCGISLSYALGRTLGLRLLKRYGRVLHVTPESIERAHATFEQVGHWALLVGYFLPGIRHLTALAAGTTRLEYPDFALFAYAGALVWSFSFISLGIIGGRHWQRLAARIHDNLALASLALVACVLLAWLLRWALRRRLQRG
jgi:membrane protein DedA with SNARE-associated domain